MAKYHKMFCLLPPCFPPDHAYSCGYEVSRCGANYYENPNEYLSDGNFYKIVVIDDSDCGTVEQNSTVDPYPTICDFVTEYMTDVAPPTYKLFAVYQQMGACPTPPPIPAPSPPPTVVPTPLPTPQQTQSPVPSLSFQPTLQPTQDPIPAPSPPPTVVPTPLPTPQKTQSPVPSPSFQPTLQPTPDPTPNPTQDPTPQRTTVPTTEPTREPTPEPTLEPTREPTLEPTQGPTIQTIPQPTPVPASPPSPMEEHSVIVDCSLDDDGLSLSIGAASGTEIPIDEEIDCFLLKHDIVAAAEKYGIKTSSCTLSGDLLVNVTPIPPNFYECLPGSVGGGPHSPAMDITPPEVDGNVSFTAPVDEMPDDAESHCGEREPSFKCMWVDVATNEWSAEGCETTYHEDTSDVECRCTHATIFAIFQHFKTSDACYNVILQNPMWLGFGVIYTTIFGAALIQTLLTIVYRPAKNKLLSFVFWQHIFIDLALLFQMAICWAMYFTENWNAPLAYLAVVWSIAYLLTFSAFCIFISEIAKYRHDMFITSTEKPRNIKIVFASISIFVFISILALLILATGSSGETLNDSVMAGSLFVAVACIFIAVSFFCYARSLIKNLKFEAGKDTCVRKDSKGVVERLNVFSFIVCLAFIIEGSVLILSAAAPSFYFQNFVACQSLYLTCDVVALISLLGMFTQVVLAQKKKRSGSGMQSSSGNQYASQNFSNSSQGNPGSPRWKKKGSRRYSSKIHPERTISDPSLRRDVANIASQASYGSSIASPSSYSTHNSPANGRAEHQSDHERSSMSNGVFDGVQMSTVQRSYNSPHWRSNGSPRSNLGAFSFQQRTYGSSRTRSNSPSRSWRNTQSPSHSPTNNLSRHIPQDPDMPNAVPPYYI